MQNRVSPDGLPAASTDVRVNLLQTPQRVKPESSLVQAWEQADSCRFLLRRLQYQLVDTLADGARQTTDPGRLAFDSTHSMYNKGYGM